MQTKDHKHSCEGQDLLSSNKRIYVATMPLQVPRDIGRYALTHIIWVACDRTDLKRQPCNELHRLAGHGKAPDFVGGVHGSGETVVLRQ